MSAINGDKARFNRKRKAGIARRARNRKKLQSGEQGKTLQRGSGAKEASA